jgi:hypothetical protein
MVSVEVPGRGPRWSRAEGGSGAGGHAGGGQGDRELNPPLTVVVTVDVGSALDDGERGRAQRQGEVGRLDRAE